MQFICYHTATAIVLGVGKSADGALTDAVHQWGVAVLT